MPYSGAPQGLLLQCLALQTPQGLVQEELAPLELTPQKREQQKLALYELIKKGLKMMKLKSAGAFSLVEAMVVLLIATIALGMSVPMISR